MARRDPVATWLLAIVTFGIYGLVWWYKIHKELQQFDPRQGIRPGLALAAMVPGNLILVPTIVTVYGAGDRIAMAQQAAGLPGEAKGGHGLLWGLLFGQHIRYYQAQVNKIIDRRPVPGGRPVMPY